MFPYQIYQSLADQHLRDLAAEARRHELVSAVRRATAVQRAAAEPTQPPSRLRGAVARVAALVHPRETALSRSAATPGSASGSVSGSPSAAASIPASRPVSAPTSASVSKSHAGPIGCIA
jgi:hypothetical protein